VNADDSILILLRRGAGGMEPLDPAEWKRVKARVAWVREAFAAWASAQQAMDNRCMAAVGRVSAEEFNRIFDEEQAKVDSARAELDAVIEHDRWPRRLYFGDI
jgi:hypothetical protein